MRQLVIRHLFCIAGLFLGVELAFAQLPPPGGPGFPPPILPPSGGLFPPQLPPPFPPPPPPPQVGQHPVFGLMCAGPLGPGPCADVHRFLLVQHAANYIQLPFLGFQPGGIPICNGPLGPGPCRDIQVFLAVRTIAQQQIQVPSWQGTGTCIGPMGPVPCPAVQDYLMQSQSGIAPGSGHLNLRRPQVLAQAGPNGQTMCGGPAGPDRLGHAGWQPPADRADRVANRCSRCTESGTGLRKPSGVGHGRVHRVHWAQGRSTAAAAGGLGLCC